MRHPRIQSLTFTAALLFGVLALVAAASTIWLSVQQRSATEVIERDAGSLELVAALERTLLAQYRAANVALATDSPPSARSVAALDEEVDRLLRRADRLTGEDAVEVGLLEDVRVARRRYLAHRERLETARLPLRELIAEVRQDFDRMMEALVTLRRHNATEVAAARAYGERLETAAWIVGVTLGVLVVLGIGALLFVVRRYVTEPLTALRGVVAEWRPGEARDEAPQRGPREIVDIGRAFNQLSAELARQREAQLTFLSAVAHDLRNPLNGLAMAAAGMRELDDEGDPAKERICGMVERQVGHLDRMVGDLLDMTRIEAGQLTLRIEPVDLRPIVTDVAELYAPTARDHPVRLCVPGSPVLVRADPLRIEQVISNLVSNAIKYSPAGSAVRVELSCEDGEARIEVEDAGGGIAEDELAAIFEPFRRSRASIDAAPGAGLGLSIVRRLVLAHDGAIEVESPPGKGALFRVRLPLEGAGAQPTDETAREPNAASRHPLAPQPV